MATSLLENRRTAVPRSRAHDRDLGIRKISYATRALAGAGIVFVGAFSVFLANRASSTPGQSTSSNPVTNQVEPSGADGASGAATPSPNDSSSQDQPQYQAPQAHTRSGGS
jgi:hypothetical protein